MGQDSPCPVALSCQEKAFCTHSRLVKGFRDEQMEGTGGRAGLGHEAAGGVESPTMVIKNREVSQHTGVFTLHLRLEALLYQHGCFKSAAETLRAQQVQCMPRSRRPEAGLATGSLDTPLLCVPLIMFPALHKCSKTQQESKNMPRKIIQWLLGGKSLMCWFLSPNHSLKK